MDGAVFRQNREKLGLSQQALADKLMISQSRLAQIEGNFKAPSVMIVKLAADIFGCTTDDLINGEATENGTTS